MPDTRNVFVKAFVWYGFIYCVTLCQYGCYSRSSPPIFTLIAKLKEGNYKTQLECLSELRKLGDKAKPAIPILIKMLEDEDSNIRAACAITLGYIGREARTAVPALVIKLNNDKDRHVRCASAGALARIGVKDNNVLTSLKKALANSDTRVQIFAAVSLTDLDQESQVAISTLTRLLTDKDEVTREMAATFLGGIKSTRIRSAIPTLVSALKDSASGVRISAAQSLGYICENSEIVVPALIERVNYERCTLARMFAIQALKEYGPEAKAAVPALTRALKDPDREIRVAAGDSLAGIKNSKKKRGQKGLQEEAEQAEKLQKEFEEKFNNRRWPWVR